MRSILAPNPGPFTLDGTRSHVLGEDAAAVIDPGPEIDSHLNALARTLGRASRVTILLTHDHADHAGGAERLAELTGGRVFGPGSGRNIEDGDSFHTSAGPLVALSTPGHSRRHFSFHHPESSAAFVGDLVLGCGKTTWIGEYPGGVADYLESLDRLEALNARTLHPAHGPPIRSAAAAIRRFRRHRLSRIAQVRRALARGYDEPAAITRQVYGPLEPHLRDMAESGVASMLDYLSGAK